MFEVIDTEKKNNAVWVYLKDDVTGKEVAFGFPDHLYSEKFLKEKIEMLDKIGLASVELPKEESPAFDLIGKKYNTTGKEFE